jgi:DMSO/TMAO reductase YedYZ heme-binding membrane subunit
MWRVPPATRARLTGDVALAVAGALLGALLGATLSAEPASTWTSVAGWFVGLGALAAVAGTFGVLMLLVLIARLPPLERTIGQHRLVGWHRRLAPWALGLVGVHVYLTTLGYALASRTQPLTQLWDLVTTAPWVLPAAAGLVLLVVAAVSSWRVARRRLPYQTWWTIHLLTYLAVAAAFAHQIDVGGPFVADTWARTVWIGLYLAVASAPSTPVAPAHEPCRVTTAAVGGRQQRGGDKHACPSDRSAMTLATVVPEAAAWPPVRRRGGAHCQPPPPP